MNLKNYNIRGANPRQMIFSLGCLKKQKKIKSPKSSKSSFVK